jgi:hypothetical protein
VLIHSKPQQKGKGYEGKIGNEACHIGETQTLREYFDGEDFIVTSPARWISSDSNGGAGGAFTALYGLRFNLPDFTSASFHVQFATDQQLGMTANDGIYLNGIALPGSGGGNYFTVLNYDNLDVSSVLQTGDNTLHFYTVNLGGPSGVLFDAAIEFTPVVPEAAPCVLLGLGALLMLFRHRLARRRNPGRGFHYGQKVAINSSAAIPRPTAPSAIVSDRPGKARRGRAWFLP